MLRLLSTLLFCAAALIGYSQITTVGIIGTATPNGWDSDTDMVQDAADTAKWTLTITLVQGEAKFRANNGWDVNWGDSAFPIGTGTQGGPNIPVPAGTYNISFNSVTGAYFFDLVSDIGVIGSATPFGWDREVFMFQSATDTNQYSITLNLLQGEAKFRANGGWDVNWGAADFPSGIGTQGGANIPVPQAGKYLIEFNKATGAYNFTEQVEFTSIGVIGSATAGGWDAETPLTRDSGNPDLWKGTVTLTVGELKFRANNAWAINWGGGEFPSDTATVNGDNIAVPTAGDYLVSFNTRTLIYTFLLIGNYTSVGIIGDATPGGWDNDTDMTQDPDDRSIWKLRIILTAGEAKFRADNDWAVNWGGGTFPNGTATQDGPNIPVTAGEYKVTFNSTTGAYTFEEIIEFAQLSLVGRSGPFQNWPGVGPCAGMNCDTYLEKNPNDGNLWSATGVALTTSADETDGGIKFRANTDWAVNWGSAAFPAGTGTLNGPNILAVAGTYNVAFNAVTGEYAFSPASSTREDLLWPSAIQLFPNPASEFVNVNIDSDKLANNIQMSVYDKFGRQVMRQTFDSKANIRLNVASLPAGMYTLSITDGKYIVGKQLVVTR